MVGMWAFLLVASALLVPPLIARFGRAPAEALLVNPGGRVKPLSLLHAMAMTGYVLGVLAGVGFMWLSFGWSSPM